MTEQDEPFFESEVFPGAQKPASPGVKQRIHRLVDAQLYAVLCTQGQGQPYGALVAFAFTPDLRRAMFATPKSTRKYRMLTECDRVALIIDNRGDPGRGLMEVEAVTVTGRARETDRNAEDERLVDALLSRHGYLESFFRAPSCAIFRVEVVRFFHVSRFQEVHQWTPTRRS